ncbi:hypothetical protein BVC93_13705 [Mycobacterium sp. MS1601]|uniref:enolase C-terminal domain-like protein n=1 Tax=Mycobacterium sp. MS1601 TaxID=1936029 RepID=UPI00097923F2|nr:enolase C-terminal domain-like protein [Mycobacterium sp. MS1601]AQA03295.1 hypothetical protein BVC93_13705 [Mycobacterium sp. MS1601]
MKTLIDFDNAVVVALPVSPGFGEPDPRESMLIEGPQGWGEFSAPGDVRALTAAVEPGTVGWPDAVRGRVPVAVQVPAVDVDRACALVRSSGCLTAEVTAGGDTPARIEAVRDALGPQGRVRVVGPDDWDVDTAVTTIRAITDAVEYVEVPRAILEGVRRRVDVPIAVVVDRAGLGGADIAVLSSSSLGGVRRALRIAETVRVPCVVRAGRESSVGLAGAVALAGALPELRYACAVSRPAWVTADITTASRELVAVDGYLPVAPMPAAPEMELLSRWAADPAAVARWRHRLSVAQQAL